MAQSLAPVLMIQGTSSNVGKSLIVTALCRWFANRGLKVAPFKAQNMALNSSVTESGAEIGCAQYFQAEAARSIATAEMNPILLKPEGERHSQVIVLGKALGSYNFRDYHEKKPELRKVIAESLLKLRQSFDLVIIEGAGSPAEINLKAHDLVNMFVALEANAPVLIVGDIDKGGVFAACVGTLELLEPRERDLVAGFIINKFRGDPSLLDSGLRMLEDRTQKKVYGLVPHLQQHGVADEDSLALDTRPSRLRRSVSGIDVGILRWPRMSNYDEFHSLEGEAETAVAFITEPRDVLDADLLILPGSKATIDDLDWCRQRGLDRAIAERVQAGLPTLAICGGYQMLGELIQDPGGFESRSKRTVAGLGLIPRQTIFVATKVTRQVVSRWQSGIWDLDSQSTYKAYEIHMGHVIATAADSQDSFPFTLSTVSSPIDSKAQDPISTSEEWLEGYVSPNGALLCTLMHGLFENLDFRLGVLNHLRQRKGLSVLKTSSVPLRDDGYDRVAAHVGESCDMHAVMRLLKLEERLMIDGKMKHDLTEI